MPGKDYYQILGVKRGSTDKDIKQAYRRLARKLHPDVNPGDKSAEAKFKEVNEAYEVLGNTETRKKYDEFGEQWKYAEQMRQAQSQSGGAPFWEFRKQGAGPQGFRFEEGDLEGLFGNLFGGRSGRRARRPRRGEDIEYQVELTLEEAYRGTTRTISLRSEAACSVCRGTGQVQNALCSACHGGGTVPVTRRIEAKIPAGVTGGSRVRLSGQGGPGVYSGENGDLYLVISVKPHPIYKRDGDDLYTDIQVPLTTAVLGGEVQIATLKGKVALKIPPETQNGKLFKLTGQGMPHLGDSVYGDLFAKVNVVLPTRLSGEEKRLFEELRKLLHEER